MSAVVVLIGYILLVPSLLGIGLGVVAFVWAVDFASDLTELISSEVGGAAEPTLTAAIYASGPLIIVVFFFFWGLLGWLLVMKKKVLQCTFCSAVTRAS